MLLPVPGRHPFIDSGLVGFNLEMENVMIAFLRLYLPLTRFSACNLRCRAASVIEDGDTWAT